MLCETKSLDPQVNSTVADAIRKFAPNYIQKYQHAMPMRHLQVLSLIMRCGTGELGNAFYKCSECDNRHWLGRSCGDRHCPNCQKQKTQAWLASQASKLLPVQHFVVTFTVPEQMRRLIRANQKAGYEAIFKAGSQVIRSLLANDKNLGSDDVGFFGVLHTWGRDPKAYHPHVHFIVPGGGLSRDRNRWLQVQADRLFHPAPARKLYKKLLTEELKSAGLYSQLPQGILKQEWVVNIKPVGDGSAVLKYLAPYVYRVAISYSRIVAVNDEKVHYRVKPSGGSRYQARQLSGEAFVRAFAQHVLPSGFQKVRYYGFMSPNNRLSLARVRLLVWAWKGWMYWLGGPACVFASPTTSIAKVTGPICSECGGSLQLQYLTDAYHRRIWERPIARKPNKSERTQRSQALGRAPP